MADLNARIKPKKSSVAGEVPQAADLEVAEIAVNTADGKLFVKHTDDSIKEISGAGGGSVLPTVTGTFIDSSATADTSQVLAAPAHSTSDLLVACIMSRASGGALTPPSGFTLYGEYLSSLTFSGDGQTISVFTKTATASEPASYTWTQASSGRICGFIAAVKKGSIITSVAENYGNGTIASIATAAGQMNITAATWIYSTTSGGETYSQSGAGVVEITDSPRNNARISGGYTTEAGIVTSTHGANTEDDNPNHGMINISLKLPSSISSLDDVDTITTPPADGQVLTWVDANSQWEPADVAGGGTVDSVNGKTGTVSLGIQDMNDFGLLSPTQTPGYNWSSYLDSNQLWDYAVNSKYKLAASPVEGTDWALTVCSFDSSGVDRDSDWATVEVGDKITLSEDGTVWHTFEVLGATRYDSDTYVGYVKPVYSLGLNELSADIPDLATWTSGFYTDPLYRADSQPLADGDYLQWVQAQQKFMPAQISGGETTYLNDLTDVKTAGKAYGDVLTWINGGAPSGNLIPEVSGSDVVEDKGPDSVPVNANTTSLAYVDGQSGGRAIDFQADGARLVFNHHSSQWLGDDFTIEAWVMWPSATNDNFAANIISKKTGWPIDLSYSFGVSAAGAVFASFSSNGTSQNTYYHGTDTNDGYGFGYDVWYHIAITRESGVLKFWVDGVQAGTSKNPTETNLFQSASLVTIGNVNTGSDGLTWYDGTKQVQEGTRLLNSEALYTGTFTPPTAPIWGDGVFDHWGPLAPSGGGGGTSSPAIVYASVIGAGTGTSGSLTLPTSVAAGDTIVIHSMARGNAGDMPTINMPSGYTAGPTLQRNDTTGSSSASSNAIYYKTAVLGDAGATVNFTLGSLVDASYTFTAAVWVVRGASYRTAYLDAWFALGGSSGTSGTLLNNTGYVAGDVFVGIAQLRPWTGFSDQIWRFDAAQGATLNHHYEESVGSAFPTSSMVSTSGAAIKTGVASATDLFATNYASASSSPVYSVIRFEA